MSDWDVVVVGAGPGGSVAAWELAKAGVSVLLVDRASFPRRKVCGGCLGAGAMRLLHALDAKESLYAAGASPLNSMELRSGSHRATISLSGHAAMARWRLDALLVDRAVDAGVVFRPACRVTSTVVAGAGVTLGLATESCAETVVAKLVIDATGLGSRLLDASNGTDAVAPGARIGLGATFDDGVGQLDGGRLRMVVGRHGYVGAVRFSDGELNVAAAVDRTALARYGPAGVVGRILGEAGLGPLPDDPATGWKGTPALTRRPSAVAGRRWFRIGDASGYVEPFTGEGMGWAIAAGRAVAPLAMAGIDDWSDALAARWTRMHRQRIGRRQRLCRWLASGLRRPKLVRGTAALLSRAPTLAAPLVHATEAVGRT